MARHRAMCWKFLTGGPFGYVVLKDGLGVKIATAIATLAAAFDAIRTDVGAQLAGETVLTATFVIFGAATYQANLSRTAADGLYAYTLAKDQVVQSEVTGIANLATALNAIRDAAGALIGADSIVRMTVDVASA